MFLLKLFCYSNIPKANRHIVSANTNPSCSLPTLAIAFSYNASPSIPRLSFNNSDTINSLYSGCP